CRSSTRRRSRTPRPPRRSRPPRRPPPPDDDEGRQSLMPPIKRTQKSVTPAPRRRLAGHAGQARPEGGNAAGPTTWDERDDDEVGGTGTGAGRGERRAGRRPGGRTIAYSAIAVGLVAGAVGVFLATEPGVDVDNRAFVDRGATEEVLSAATT